MTCVLVTCSGVSNTGKLTTQAALALMQRRPGHYVRVDAKQSAATLEAELSYADKIIVIDGCTECCAMKKMPKSPVGPPVHIIATDLGIEKNGMAEVQFHEIGILADAVKDAENHP
ncbi:MAG: putative zinc-binding protein [Methanoregula sp.]|nr:putative zinc-binding protein [Methanoregula sp.]